MKTEPVNLELAAVFIGKNYTAEFEAVLLDSLKKISANK